MTESNPCDPRSVALEAMEKVPLQATGLVAYQSAGRVLIIGPAQRIDIADRLPDGLTAIPLPLDADSGTGPRVEGRAVHLEGHLGRFRVQLEDGGESWSLEADLVLDLGTPPLLGMPMKPPGYLAPEAGALDAALEELAGLTGTFDKPAYFHYDADRCAHGRNGVTACTRCIDACPAEAIQGLADVVDVDPFRCQGGGICASVCPSGAIGYAYPTRGDLIGRIRRLLLAYDEAGGEGPVLLFHARERLPEGVLSRHPGWLPVAVEEVASVGPEIWLSALAYGARQVLLERDAAQPERVGQALEGPLRMVAEMLRGLGYPDRAVILGDLESLLAEGHPAMPERPPARHAAMEDKRTALFLALDHLQDQAAKVRPLINLPTGSPFGSAFVEAAACTLCMACASVCPGQALQDGQGRPQLRFIEANCIQCGLCTRSCPEDAIWIMPRLLLDPEARSRPRVLHEEEPFCCVTCGKPFATRSVIDSLLNRLSGHWMFQTGQARRRLQMCEACRVVDVVQDPEMMQSREPVRQ